MNKSMEYLNKLLNDDDTVVLGVSGGPDSMCLLSLLLQVREQVNIKIVVCHVNHMVRREALEEEAFVRKFALDNKCFFELKTLAKRNNVNINETLIAGEGKVPYRIKNNKANCFKISC